MSLRTGVSSVQWQKEVKRTQQKTRNLLSDKITVKTTNKQRTVSVLKSEEKGLLSGKKSNFGLRRSLQGKMGTSPTNLSKSPIIKGNRRANKKLPKNMHVPVCSIKLDVTNQQA